MFESNGVPLALVKLYLRLYTHSALQAVFKAYPLTQRHIMVRGAISGIRDTPDGYEFSKVFDKLEAVFEGRHQFDPRVAGASRSDRLDYLALPTANVLVSRYLLEKFVLPHMKNKEAFFTDFHSYCGEVGMGIVVTYRAMNSVLSQAKISS